MSFWTSLNEIGRPLCDLKLEVAVSRRKMTRIKFPTTYRQRLSFIWVHRKEINVTFLVFLVVNQDSSIFHI